ncbi:RacP protein [Streptomyces sp. NPDC048281]|uniref:RacP protein n=1 Tax=Streptomyces sp. NPDC048281 TaxID=3154715 RepID=UPI003445C9E4
MDKRSPTAERHADLVRTALLRTAPAGMTLFALAAVCGLSRWQTRRAITALKNICAQNEWPPLLWTRERDYHFCADETELENWERAWISERLTQFRRMLTGTLGPHLLLFPHSAWAEYLTAQVRAIESNLEMASRPGAR